MSEVEVGGMNMRDFHAKCSGSVFYINGELYNCESAHGTNSDSEEDSNFLITGSLMVDELWRSAAIHPEDTSHEIVCDFSHPELGYINMWGAAHYLSRHAERQWKVGFNRRNISVGNNFDRDMREVNIPKIENNLNLAAVVREIFSPFYYSWDQALSYVSNSNKFSAAFHKYVCFSQSVHFPHVLIVYKDIPVGYVDTDTREKFLFPSGDYVQAILPFTATIKEDLDDVIVRSNWG